MSVLGNKSVKSVVMPHKIHKDTEFVFTSSLKIVLDFSSVLTVSLPGPVIGCSSVYSSLFPVVTELRSKINFLSQLFAELNLTRANV